MCSNCGLDLNHPDAELLREESLNVAELLESRLEIIGKIRFETAAERTRLAAIAGVADYPVNTEAPISAELPASVEDAVSPVSEVVLPIATTASASASASQTNQLPSGAGETSPPARSHSGIQVLLLVVGVSLLSVGAIFFLIYAFLTFGLIWRSAIIASITIASIVAATKMKERGLAATGEALSALSVVLVILDIFAIRANDLLVVGDPEGRIYWGAALLIASLGFMFWHRSSKLVLVNVVGFILFPAAAGILAAGLTTQQNTGSSMLAVATAIAVASLIHSVAAHDSYPAVAERAIAISYAMLALTFSLVSAPFTGSGFVDGGNSADAETSVWLFALAGIAAVHVILLRSDAISISIRYAFALMSGLLLGSALWMVLTQNSRSAIDTQAAPSLALAVLASLTLVALFVEMLGRRSPDVVRASTFWASVGVWAVTAAAALVPLGQSAIVAVSYVAQQDSRRTTPASAPFDLIEFGWPQLALVTVPLAMAAVWALTGQLRARIHLVLATAGLALALAAPLTGTLLGACITWLVLAALAVVIIAIDRNRRGPRRIHLTIAAGGLLPLLLAYSSGWSSHQTWVLTSIATAAILIAARSLIELAVARAAFIGTTAVVLIVAAGGAGEQLQFALTEQQPDILESWLTAGIAAVMVLGFSLWSGAPRLDALERRILWWVGLSVTTLAAANLWTASVADASFAASSLVLDLSIVSLIVALVALVLLGLSLKASVFVDANDIRYTAAALLAPATVWALDSASRAIGLSTIAIELAPATASVLIGTLTMVLRVRALHPRVRRISEASALLVAAITSANAVLEPRASHWLIVSLVSITLLLASISADGLVGSKSPRRHLVWAAVLFGTWALWLRLDQSQVDALEAYVLPVAAIVLLIAVFTARAELRGTRLSAAPPIALAGLLIAILPLALNAASGDGLQTLIIAGLCGALLLTAAFVEPLERFVDIWGVAILASTVGLVVSTASRAFVLGSEYRSYLPELDSWLLGAVGVIALASFGLAASSLTRTPTTSLWTVRSDVLLGTAIVLLYAVETAVLLDTGSVDRAIDGIRIVTLVTIGSALLVLMARPSIAPLSHGISRLAFALAGVVGAIAYVGGLITPLEWVTVPLGAALLIHGALRMARTPALRSFPALSAGLLVFMLPSLLATFIETTSDATAWRILAVGVIAVAVIVAGSWLKLQAPLVIGATVALIHAAHTFAPALVTLYQLTDWWVWAVVGGAIVLFLGITLERRIRDLTVLNSRFSSLR